VSLREADEIKKILADMKTSQPALGWSHPEWLVEKWRENFGDEKTRQLLEWNNTPPKTFARINTLKTDAGKLVERWREENVEYDFVTRDWTGENLAFELKSHPPLNSLPSFRDGWFYLQDPGTLLAPAMLGAKAGETILDLCAAPGGKTKFLAQLMNDTGKIVAHDISEERLKLIRENCARLDVTCVETVLPSTLNSELSTQTARLGSLKWLREIGVEVSAAEKFIADWSAQGATIVGFAIQESLVALFAIKDTVKPGAAKVIEQLQRQGLKTFLVTGDNQATARSIAAHLGTDHHEIMVGQETLLAEFENILAPGQVADVRPDPIEAFEIETDLVKIAPTT